MPAPSHPLPTGAAIDPAIARGIRQASAATSVDFGFLVSAASQESGLHADAKASHGTASGLFQFIDSTWLQMVQRFGAKYGIGELAQQVSFDGSGKTHVADPSVRQQILDLRKDPRLSAAFAAEYTKSNKAEVERALGHSVDNTGLYMAHFLGANGATEFLKAAQSNGKAIAAELLPEAAAANRAVFYDNRTGEPRTVAEIYSGFAAKFKQGSHALDGLSAMSVADPAAAAASGKFGVVRSFASMLGQFGTAGGVLSDTMRTLFNAFAASAVRMIRSGTSGAPHTAGSPTAPTTPAHHHDPREV